MVTRNSPGPAPVVFQTAFFDARLEKAISGKLYGFGRTDVGIAVANDFLKAIIKNPAGSGVTVHVTKCTVACSSTTRFIAEAPLTGVGPVPGTAATPQVARAGQAAAKATGGYTDAAAAPSEPIFKDARVPANTPLDILLGLILPENSHVILSLRIPLTTDSYAHSPEWYEE